MPTTPDITVLLDRAREGDGQALDRLLPLVYDELRVLASRQRRRTGAAETLNTTAVVHEAYEKLAGRADLAFANRLHFFRIAGRVMRDVLVDYARAQRSLKRGGPAPLVPLDAVAPVLGDARASASTRSSPSTPPSAGSKGSTSGRRAWSSAATSPG